MSRGVPDHAVCWAKKVPTSTSGWMPVRHRRISFTITDQSTDSTMSEVLDASPPRHVIDSGTVNNGSMSIADPPAAK